jgi:triosephosphate isomerase
VAANWKMNLLRAEASAWCRAVRRELEAVPARSTVLVFPSFPMIPDVAGELRGSVLEVGGQDLHPEDKGAFTGDVSGAQLADAGCAWALCGHSERRHGHGEGDELVGRKIAAAARHGLAPMICIGETRAERHEGATFSVLERQVRSAVSSLGDPEGRRFAFAYEPVWAIGTGETAAPETAQETHGFLRELLGELLGAERAAVLPILYGGSATAENCPSLIAGPDIDGFLVGGASLDPGKFLGIIRGSD